MSKLALVFIA